MSGKKFKFRIDSEGSSAIKEVISKTSTVSGTRIDVSMGVTKEFNLCPLAVFKNNILLPIESTDGLERGRGKAALYYPIEHISYICTLTIVVKNNQVKSKKLTIYIPKGIMSADELYCDRVTGSFSQDVKQGIANNLLTFAISRI